MGRSKKGEKRSCQPVNREYPFRVKWKTTPINFHSKHLRCEKKGAWKLSTTNTIVAHPARPAYLTRQESLGDEARKKQITTRHVEKIKEEVNCYK